MNLAKLKILSRSKENHSLENVLQLRYTFQRDTQKVSKLMASVNVRIDDTLKAQAEEIYRKFGMSPSDAIRIFYSQTCLKKAFPIDLKIPNDVTLKTFEETDKGENLVECEDANDMFKKLGI